jgi:HTH-type transcriptional regulator, transcriptional repressor of NAD biosynthesis genes
MKAARVVLFGPESTGKSTLAGRLAARFVEPFSEEYVRRYWDEHGAVITAADLDAINHGQLAAEDAAMATARRISFHDTDLLTCVLWDDLLFAGECPPWTRPEAERRARATTLWLFCDTDLAWEPDPQRCFPDEAGRAMCRKLWLDTLAGLGVSPVMIQGDWAERERRAVAAVEKLLRA